MRNNKQQNAVGLLIEEANKEWGEYKKTMTKNKQQTSVDSIIEFMKNNQYFIGNDLYEFLEQAKAMHKGEMEDTWEEAITNYAERGGNYVLACEDFHDYYNKTYGEQ
jgi:hypothetical protein